MFFGLITHASLIIFFKSVVYCIGSLGLAQIVQINICYFEFIKHAYEGNLVLSFMD
ncbi:hypothetical protein J2W95_002168 [Flavobacterium granuli]|uniref:Uncharacterized protein n=1 Tax=Flavobacterium granuli TaxID=280093 RepID=A0ABU1S360_9FLAO|nr:hypothetical protein [Flavobacterium granuli]